MLKPLFKISDRNISGIIQPVLVIRIAGHYCCFAITNADGSKLDQLAYYSCDEMNVDVLQGIFSSHAVLDTSFSRVFISYDYPQNVMIPLTHYHSEDARLMLNTMCGNTANASIISEIVPGWQIYNVYTVPIEIHDWLSRKFSTGKYWHHYSVAIKTISGADYSGCISIDFGTNSFCLLAGQSNKFLLAQNFPYSTPADVVYYLLKTCQQLNLSQQNVKLFLSGLIEKDSALYKELHQYFLHVEFREASWNSNEYPAHFFTSLNDLARCES